MSDINKEIVVICVCADKIDETDIFKAELEHLRGENYHLRQENQDLKGAGNQPPLSRNSPESSGLGPQMLSQVKRTLTRKLVGDSSHPQHHSKSPPVQSPSSALAVGPSIIAADTGNFINDVTDEHKIKGETNTAYVGAIFFCYGFMEFVIGLFCIGK